MWLIMFKCNVQSMHEYIKRVKWGELGGRCKMHCTDDWAQRATETRSIADIVCKPKRNGKHH